MMKKLLFLSIALAFSFASVAQNTITWNGSQGPNWNNVNNWTPPGVPGENDNVSITATSNQPVLNNLETTINSLEFKENSTLILIGTLAKLTVKEDVTDEGGTTIIDVGQGLTVNGDYILNGERSHQGTVSVGSLTVNTGGKLTLIGVNTTFTVTGLPTPSSNEAMLPKELEEEMVENK